MPERAGQGSALGPLRAERAGIPARTLGVFSVAFAAVLGVLGYVAYRELLHYEPRALEHVPEGAELVARVDLTQVRLFEPARRHLLPLLDAAPLGPAPAAAEAHGAPQPSRLARLREAGVLNLAMDLREVVFARRAHGWVLAFGGMMEPAGLIDGIERVLSSEPGARLRRDAGVLLLEPSGVALGQAEDGVLLLSSDRELLSAALPSGAKPTAFGELERGAASVGALPGWFRSWPRASEAPELLGSITRGTGWLELAEPLQVSFQVELAAATGAAGLQLALEGWLGADAGSDFVPLADWAGERAVLARAQYTQRGPSQIAVTSTWHAAELDRAARSLANWLGARLRAIGPAAPRSPAPAAGVPRDP